ncbi:unnamed protein product [Bursaphelenchus xylophilus]|nr:unnamed protein product [Bursaphelenchus xylophilus]CAG9122519.1 unnamed protein product [Bursaphelenchus xylophilus]
MRQCQLTTLLLWGCGAAVILWLIMVMKLSSRVDNSQFSDISQQQQLNSALSEIDRLRRETAELKKKLEASNSEAKSDQKLELNPVLPEPKINIIDGKLYTKEHEVERRELDNQIRELFYYLRSQTDSENGEIKDKVNFRQRVLNQTISLMALSTNFGSLVDQSAVWHKQELQKLTDHIQKRIYDLQHPSSCSNTRVLVCDLNKGCGFGCQLHHVSYCLTVAAASNRTMVLQQDGEGWRYSKHGWTAVFEDVSGCRYGDAVQKSEKVEAWRSIDQPDRVTFLTIVDALHTKPAQLPLSFPKELANELLTHHSNPPVFFESQFVWYLMRSNDHMREILDKAASKIPFGEGPIVGLQIRRTDKIGLEAAFHSVDEYMKWTELWYKVQEKRLSPERPLKRRVYIATDDPNAVKEAREKYPAYEVYADVGIAQSAQLSNRYTDVSLYGVVTDVHMLSRCDYLVCTFSSQVCRVGYELKQVKDGDVAEKFHSLDDIYYYGGQHGHEQITYERHEKLASNELAMEVGDTIGIAGNHWDGWSKGINKRTGETGLYPSYKTREKWRIVDFPLFAL